MQNKTPHKPGLFGEDGIINVKELFQNRHAKLPSPPSRNLIPHIQDSTWPHVFWKGPQKMLAHTAPSCAVEIWEVIDSMCTPFLTNTWLTLEGNMQEIMDIDSKNYRIHLIEWILVPWALRGSWAICPVGNKARAGHIEIIESRVMPIVAWQQGCPMLDLTNDNM